MLADVRAQVELLLDGNERRDALSAFNVLQPRAGPSTSAPRRRRRGACASSSTRCAPASARRERQALRQHPLAHRSRGRPLRHEAHAPDLAGSAHRPNGRRCSSASRTRPTGRGSSGWRTTARRSASPPDEVRSEHLVGLHDALEEECMTKHPAQGHQAHDRHVEPLRADGARLAARPCSPRPSRRSRTRCRSTGSRRASAPTSRAGSSA